jgi:hypothetical protein
MKETINMSKKMFYLIVSLCTAIIIANSIEAFIKVKDLGLFETWLANPNLNIDRSQNTNQIYSIYLTMCLSIFIMRIITPVALSLNTYFAFIKTKVNKLFVLIWIILLVGLFIFTSIGELYFSIFFIISAICHIGLLFTMIYIWKEINKQKNIIIAEKIN